MKSLQLTLVELETKLVLESLSELEAKWAGICDSSDDSDEIADHGNDLLACAKRKQV